MKLIKKYRLRMGDITNMKNRKVENDLSIF